MEGAGGVAFDSWECWMKNWSVAVGRGVVLKGFLQPSGGMLVFGNRGVFITQSFE